MITTSNQTSRQLAAIMFADMAGYTAMMQEDEMNAKSLRDRMLSVLEVLVPKYQGKIVQLYGDGSLTTFCSAVQAVRCAIEIQKELQSAPNVPVRIGLHSGDVCIDGQHIFGDSVNIASRIEALSVSGSVLISDKVYEEIKNQKEIKVACLGKYNLKNVKRQVEIFAVSAEKLTVPTQAQIGIQSGPQRSIAVLPFINFSANRDNEHFSDGMTEEILNALCQVAGLQVCSRTSSFTFKGQREDIRSVGKKLCVASIMEGSIRKSGNKVRITVQLIDVENGFHIWSEVFDRNLGDVFEIQEEVSGRVADKIGKLLKIPVPNN